MKRGEAFEEYDGQQLLQKFGRDLVDAFAEGNQPWLLGAAERHQNWKAKYEHQMRKCSASRLKREMIRESFADLGVRELRLPLLDRNVAPMKEGKPDPDSEFIRKVMQTVRETGYILHIEIEFEERSSKEWQEVFSVFVSALEKSGRDVINKCRFHVYFSSMERAEQVKELTSHMTQLVDPKHVKPALRFA